MEKIKSRASIEVKVNIELTEQEAQALLAMTGYGTKPFLDWFYKCLGKYYLKPFEQGVYSLFESIKQQLPIHLRRAENARKAFNGNNI